MMKVISSQRFLDFQIVEDKIAFLEDSYATEVVIPIMNAYFKALEGNDLYILVDGHHRLAAATELGINVEFEEIENETGLEGEEFLNFEFMDSNWYYIESGVDVW